MDAASIRNDLVGLAQRRETANYVEAVRAILASHQDDVQLLDTLHVLHITVWLTECGDALWRELLRIGCSPFACDFNGDTTLHYAIRSANLAYIQHLHSKIGDRILNVVNHQLCNLMITCCAETPDEPSTDVLLCLEWLYLHGVTLEAQDSQGKTALMWAAQRNSLTICHWLVSRHAHLAHRDHMNRTALHVASSSGNYDVVLFLAEQGGIKMISSESHDDRRINTPVRMAWQRGHLWLSLSLLTWRICYNIFGRCCFIRSPYGCIAISLLLWNFLCGEIMYYNILSSAGSSGSGAATDGSYMYNCLYFTCMMTLTLLFWLLAAKSDPGSIRRRSRVLMTQVNECSDSAERDLKIYATKPGVGAAGGGASARLHELEVEVKRVGMKIGYLNKECHGIVRRENKVRLDQMMESLERVHNDMNQLRPQVARERQKLMSSYYVKKVLNPFIPIPCPKNYSNLPVTGICLTCHHIKTIRQHHCPDCGICVHRFDHHCAWIDNCVGLKNQTFFLLFLLCIFLSLLHYAYTTVLYVDSNVMKRASGAARLGGDDSEITYNLLNLILTPLFYITILNLLTNLLWGCFTTYLLVRTARSMLTDVTFYEIMKKHPYVERRFGRNLNKPLWDFKNLTLKDALLNALHFLTQSSNRDHLNYDPHHVNNALLHQEV